MSIGLPKGMTRDDAYVQGVADGEAGLDILDVAVTHIANDDYNHIDEGTLRARLADIRRTRIESNLQEEADGFIESVRLALTQPGDPEYGEAPICDICGQPEDQDPTNGREYDWNGETGNHATCEATVKARLEYLRGEIEAERISYGEIAELQSLAEHIDPSDVVLLQWAGVPEK